MDQVDQIIGQQFSQDQCSFGQRRRQDALEGAIILFLNEAGSKGQDYKEDPEYRIPRYVLFGGSGLPIVYQGPEGDDL